MGVSKIPVLQGYILSAKLKPSHDAAVAENWSWRRASARFAAVVPSLMSQVSENSHNVVRFVNMTIYAHL
jgi:hypothetical protein